MVLPDKFSPLCKTSSIFCIIILCTPCNSSFKRFKFRLRVFRASEKFFFAFCMYVSTVKFTNDDTEVSSSEQCQENFGSPGSFEEVFSIIPNSYCLYYYFYLSKNKKKETKQGMSPAGIYLLKVNNRNIRTRSEICSKLTTKTPE